MKVLILLCTGWSLSSLVSTDGQGLPEQKVITPFWFSFNNCLFIETQSVFILEFYAKNLILQLFSLTWSLIEIIITLFYWRLKTKHSILSGSTSVIDDNLSYDFCHDLFPVILSFYVQTVSLPRKLVQRTRITWCEINLN